MLTNLEGTRLDAYRLTRRLGGGTFGDVYLAEDLHQSTQVAIKVMEPPKTQEAVQQFLREVRALVRLDHPHIIPIRDFGVDENTGIPFIVMEYAPNGSLRQHHHKGTQVPLETVVSYVRQIADALQHAHDDKLVHRDVKPDNVLIDANNELLLSDFGIATSSPTFDMNISQPVQQNVAGSASYMAPEQCLGKPEKASDQYALAIMTYEWLCGTCPFKGDTPFVAYNQHINIAPKPLRELVTEIPSQIETVVMKALAKAPKDRYTNISEFAVALEDAYQQHLKGKKTKEQWLSEADKHFYANRYEEAITCYTHATELFPKDAMAYIRRGIVYYQLKQYQDAIADFTHALELDLDNLWPFYYHGDVYYRRGLAYEQTKQYWQSLQDYVRVLELDSNDRQASDGKERVKERLKL